MPDFHPFFHNDLDDDLAVLPAQPKLKKPSLYRVILLNDDFTPMDFVIEILISFFGMSEEQATAIMLQVHTRGVGICGTYSKDVAETKVYIVNSYALENDHPLKCAMEEL
jgi:ATP-dependent Clp protease adaptor protein ClpS